VSRKKTAAQLDREVAKAIKKPAMTIKRADEVIRAAQLEGFSGQCGRAAIAISRVVFGDKGRYVIATNPHVNASSVWKRRAGNRLFMPHVAVEWKGRLFDARGLIDDESLVEDWAIIDDADDPDSDYGFLKLTEAQASDAQLHYIDDVFPSRAAQERAIEAGTGTPWGQKCPLRDIERALREAMAS